MQIDFTPNSFDLSAPVSKLVDAALEVDRDRQTPRAYLGGSRLGEECERKLGFEFQHYPSEKPFEGQTLRRFQRGHDAEIRMARYLRMAGFDLHTEKSDGRQFGFYVAKDENGVARIAGHLDGIFVAGPDLSRLDGEPDLQRLLAQMRFPALWEHKGLNNKGIGDLRRIGLARAYPVYYAQMQTYMAYLDLTDNPGLFTAENQDDCTIYAELIPFNLPAAQAASDRGARVVQARDPYELPRVTRDPADYRCRCCAFEFQCWNPAPFSGAALPQAVVASPVAQPIAAPPQPTAAAHPVMAAPAWLTKPTQPGGPS